jgi:hypothetical protein
MPRDGLNTLTNRRAVAPEEPPPQSAKAYSRPIDWTLEAEAFTGLADQVLNVPGNGVGPQADGAVGGRSAGDPSGQSGSMPPRSPSPYQKREGSSGKVIRRADDAILCARLLANLYAVSAEQHLTTLGIHVNADWYAKHKANLPPFVSKRRFVRVYQKLLDLGLVRVHARGFEGVSTRVVPTAKLLVLFRQCGPVRLRQDAHGGDEIELRGPVQKVQRVAKRGKRAGQKVTDRVPGAPLPFAETDNTDWARQELRKINASLQSVEIGWAETPEAHAAWQKMTTGENGKRRRAPNMNKVRLKRIYNRDLSTGGRMYGGWWQSVPGDFRRHITINGAATSELDWEALHLRLCYVMSGQPAPYMEKEGQWYELPGVSSRWRKLVKLLTNQMLNCSSDEQAIRATMDERMKSPAPKKANEPSELELWRAFKVECVERNGGKKPGAVKAELTRWTQLIRERHRPVANWFDSADSGGTLQNADSALMGTVLRLAINRGIVALPIHDSVIVAKRDVAAMRDIMHSTFNHGASGGIFGQIGDAIKLKNDK